MHFKEEAEHEEEGAAARENAAACEESDSDFCLGDSEPDFSSPNPPAAAAASSPPVDANPTSPPSAGPGWVERSADEIMADQAPSKSRDVYERSWVLFGEFLARDIDHWEPTEQDYIRYVGKLH